MQKVIMQKVFSKLLIVAVILGLTACNGKEEVNNMAGTWNISTLTYEGENLFDKIEELSSTVGMDMSSVTECISAAQLILADDWTFAFSMCDQNVDGTYSFDDATGICTLTINDPEISDTEVTINGTYADGRLTFKLSDFLQSVVNLEDIIIGQLEANGIEVNALIEAALQLVINEISGAEGEAVLVKA